jgi:hypothetical protein
MGSPLKPSYLYADSRGTDRTRFRIDTPKRIIAAQLGPVIRGEAHAE